MLIKHMCLNLKQHKDYCSVLKYPILLHRMIQRFSYSLNISLFNCLITIIYSKLFMCMIMSNLFYKYKQNFLVGNTGILNLLDIYFYFRIKNLFIFIFIQISLSLVGLISIFIEAYNKYFFRKEKKNINNCKNNSSIH